jgi:hypothetical protein
MLRGADENLGVSVLRSRAVTQCPSQGGDLEPAVIPAGLDDLREKNGAAQVGARARVRHITNNRMRA